MHSVSNIHSNLEVIIVYLYGQDGIHNIYHLVYNQTNFILIKCNSSRYMKCNYGMAFIYSDIYVYVCMSM